MKYSDKLTGDVGRDFTLFVGSPPAAPEDEPIVKQAVEFFTAHFADAEYDPGNEDAVIRFCQMGPGGNFGSPNTVAEVALEYPGYTADIEAAIEAAWAADQD